MTYDSSINTALKSTFGSVGAPSDLVISIYVSDNEPTKMADITDAAFVGAGYKFTDVLGSDTKLTSKNNTGTGFYTKTGASDVLVSLSDSSPYTTNSTPPSGVDPTLYQKFLDQIKGKKSVVALFSATNLVQSFFKATDLSGGTPTVAK